MPRRFRGLRAERVRRADRRRVHGFAHDGRDVLRRVTTTWQTGRPHLRAVYELSRLDQDGETAVGEPMILNDLGQAVQGWSLPVRGWPASSYRLRVTVEDLLSGQVAAGLTVFSVRDGPQEAS